MSDSLRSERHNLGTFTLGELAPWALLVGSSPPSERSTAAFGALVLARHPRALPEPAKCEGGDAEGARIDLSC